MKRDRILLIATVACVIGAAVWGFSLAGSPETRRLERLDELRLQHLRAIVREIQRQVNDDNDMTALERPLPTDLETVAERALDERLVLVDPGTGIPYGYTVKSATTYEICAPFVLPRDEDRQVFWNHPAAAHCFTVDALDPPG